MYTRVCIETWNSGASDESFFQLTSALAYVLPGDYLEFLREHDGGEGSVGENYLILWKTEELIAFNREYETDQYAPGLFLFGSDGGGVGYGFVTRDPAMPIVKVEFIGMSLDDMDVVAAGFSELIDRLIEI